MIPAIKFAFVAHLPQILGPSRNPGSVCMLTWLSIPLLATFSSSLIHAPPGLKRYSAQIDPQPQCKRCLLEIFSRFGLPRTLVFDNGPEFVALKPWLSRMNCRKLETPAYKPSSNGTAECAVQTIKHAIAGYTPAMGSLTATCIFC